tara:strand:- start:175 stop:672 length:498 start_codon:yes stop_codon:yes gene_type:complete
MNKIAILMLLLTGCASPTKLINRAIKKDANILESVTSSEVIYKTDTVSIVLDGEVLEVPVKVPMKVPVVRWVKKRTNKEERIDVRLQKAQLKRYKIVNDSLSLNNKKLKQEARLLRAEANSKSRKNGVEIINLIKKYWVLIIMLIFTLKYLPNFITWIIKHKNKE